MHIAIIAGAALLALLPAAAPLAQGAKGIVGALERARVIDLSHTWDAASPIAGVNPPYSFALRDTHEATRGKFGDGGQLSFASETMQWSGQHGAPSIDSLGHIGHDGKLFGGVDAAAATRDPDGIGAGGVGAHLAIDRFPEELLVNRGVLLDVATMIQGDASPLPAGFEVTAKHLEDAARRQRVKLRKGDTVLIRTGWGQHFASQPKLYAGDASPGPSLDAADWLVRQGARIVGNDTLTFEMRPPIVKAPKFQVFPVHMRLIADAGVYIIENLNLEELAKARAYEFAVVVPPLKIRGGTGSALRAFAIVDKRR